MPEPYLTMADIAAIYHVHPRTARRWAAADHWRRTSTRPLRYSLEDAQRSYEQRHGGRIERHLLERMSAMPSRIDREQVRYGLGYIAGKYQLGGAEDAMGGCDYCQGYRSPCDCTVDCRTTDSPIGPCPQSEEGKRIIADHWKQPPP